MASNNVLNVDDSNFESEILNASGPVLVDFHATWCGPCKVLGPIVDQLADDFTGKLKVAKIDIDKAPNVASKYAIRSVPTVMVFEGGERKVTHMGLAKRAKLLELTGLG